MTTAMAEVSPECQRWDQRYQDEELFFGVEPTPHLVSTLRASLIPTGMQRRALCLGEGEGRDALFLAREGWQVTAVDGSRVGLEKLQARAAANGLSIDTRCQDLAVFFPEPCSYSLICSFYCHLPAELWQLVLNRAASALANGGLFVFEGFSVNQVRNQRTSGGPKARELLYEPEPLRAQLARQLEVLYLAEQTVEINYGRHSGIAEIVRGIARATR